MFSLLLLACAPAPGDVAGLLESLDAADLTDPTAKDDWAGAYTRLVLQRTWAELTPADLPFDDPACPVRSEAADGTVTWTGDCVEADSADPEDTTPDWLGVLTVREDGVEAVGFGPRSGDLFTRCWDRTWGTTTREVGGAGEGTIVYTVESGVWTTCEGFTKKVGDALVTEYEAVVRVDGTRSVYEGHGTVGRWPHVGRVEASTEGMWFQLCEDEPDAGSTTITSRGHTLEYDYGANDLDEGECVSDGKVPVALDGESLGLVDFPMCATSPRGAAGGALVLSLLLLGRRATGRRRDGDPPIRICLVWNKRAGC